MGAELGSKGDELLQLFLTGDGGVGRARKMRWGRCADVEGQRVYIFRWVRWMKQSARPWRRDEDVDRADVTKW